MILALALLGAASAAPMELTHSGRLIDTAGMPLDGPHSVTLSLYADDSTSSALWTEVHDGASQAMVDFDNGYFSVRLGADAANPLDNTVFDGTTRYIGLEVDASGELGRQPIVSVPYAMNAATAVNLDGGTVNASEISVNGNVVIDSSGSLTASGTLSSLACGSGDTAIYNGSAWVCSPLSWTNLANIPADFLDGSDADLLAATTCPPGQLLAYSGLGWACVDDQVLDDAAVDAFIENGPLTLDAGTTLGGALISTGAHYGDSDVLAVVGTAGNGNALNHSRYSNAEAVTAVGPHYTDANVVDGPLQLHPATTLGAASISTGAHYSDANVEDGPLTLDAATTLGGAIISTGAHYGDLDAVAAMGTLGDGNALNHDRYSDVLARAAVGPHTPAYLDSDAVAAMGTAGTGNALNHSRYSNAEAISAVGPHYTDVQARAAVGPHTPAYLDSDAVAAMGAAGNGNTLNHARYSNAEAVAAVEAANPLSLSGGLRTQSNKVQRDFLTWSTTANNNVPIHIKTNIRVKTDIMFRIAVEGYNYGQSASINSDTVGYTHTTAACTFRVQNNDYANGVAISHYCSSDGFLVVRLDPISSNYYIGFSVSAWLLNPTGTGFAVSGQVFHQAANL